MQDAAQEQLDAVYEDLDVDAMPDTLQLRIAETIVRLPEDVVSFAIHNIHWRLFEPTWRGVTYLLPERPPPMVSTDEEWLTLLEQRQQAPAMERRWLVMLIMTWSQMMLIRKPHAGRLRTKLPTQC